MSSLTHIFGELDRPKIECAADEPCIWIRGRNDTVSLTLDRRQRDQLRAALDECDEFDKPITTVGEAVLNGTLPDFVRVNHSAVPDIFAFAPPTPGEGVLIAASLLANAFKKSGETQAEEDARRLRVLQDNLRGFP